MIWQESINLVLSITLLLSKLRPGIFVLLIFTPQSVIGCIESMGLSFSCIFCRLLIQDNKLEETNSSRVSV